MKSSLIKIGNSKGVRINSNIIKECELDNEVEIKVTAIDPTTTKIENIAGTTLAELRASILI